jgi:hypothetical protein
LASRVGPSSSFHFFTFRAQPDKPALSQVYLEQVPDGSLILEPVAFCNGPIGGPTRRRTFGDRVRGAEIRAENARQRAKEAAGEAGRC